MINNAHFTKTYFVVHLRAHTLSLVIAVQNTFWIDIKKLSSKNAASTTEMRIKAKCQC